MNNTKKFNMNKRIIAIVLILFTILSNISPIFAASGTGTWVGKQYDTLIKTSEYADKSYGVYLRRLTNSATGEQKTVFCSEHGVGFYSGVKYDGKYYTPTSPEMRHACKVAYCGWYSKYGDYVVGDEMLTSKMRDRMLDYVYTQQYIWEIIANSSDTFLDAGIQQGYIAFKNNVDAKINSLSVKPSFIGELIELNAGETKVIKDDNYVLSQYPSLDKTVDGIRIVHNSGENTLQITVSSDCHVSQYRISDATFTSWGMVKEETKDNDTTIYFELQDGVQNQLYALHYNDPVSLSLDLKLNLYGKLELQKLDTNGKLIDGAIFNIKGNEYNQDVEVKNGKIVVEQLREGSYTITEKSAPSGYLLDIKAYNVEVKANQTTTQAIVDKEPTGSFELIKKNATKTKNLAGAEYRIWGNEYDKTLKTDAQGKINVSGLKLGKYQYQETKAPEGYLLDNTIYSFELKYKDQNTSVVYESVERTNEEPTGTFTLVKKNADKSANLKGAEYRIWGNNYDKTFITNEKGEIKVENLKLGTYNYQEVKAPEGYLIDNSTYQFELKYKDQNTSVVFDNVERTDKEPTATISIEKKDAKTGATTQGDSSFKDAVYKVYAKEDIYNKSKTKKYYSKNDLVATRTMDEKGKTEDVTGLPLGKYVVKEETAPKGYLLDTVEHEVNLVYKDQNVKVVSELVTSIEQVKSMQLHIFKSGIKVNSGMVKGIEGAEFTIKLNSDVEKAMAKGYTYEEIWNGADEQGNKVTVDAKRVKEAQTIAPSYESIVTDSEGNAYTQNKLPFGKYWVKETKTPVDFETAADFTFTINKDESEIKEVAQKVKHIMVNDEQLESYIKLVKKDVKTNKIVSLSSATFEIKAASDIIDRGTGKTLYRKGDKITQKIGNTTYTSFTTNADNKVVPDNSYVSDKDAKGTTVTPLRLPVGKYEISEIKIPNGFLQLEKSIVFDVKYIKDYDTDKDGDFIKEVVIKNEQPTGTIVVDKSVALKENVDTSLVDISDLSGIEFKLTAKENIIDAADGSVIYEKGKEIKKYNLSKDGKLTISNLPMGVYEIQETKTLDGLVLNNTKYEIKFTQKDTTTKVYTETRPVVNDTTLVELSKSTITGDKELVGAKLSVIDENGKVVDAWVSSNKAHTIEGLIVGKTYTLRENLAPLGYVKSTDIKFTVNNTKDMQKVKMIDKVVEMTKSDIGGKEIEGAKIKVFDKDGKVVDEWTSTKEPHKINNLVEGQKYTLHEEIAPNGYVKATDVEFTVTTDKETQHIEMIDKIVEMTKSDIGGEEIEGAEIKVFDKDGKVVDEWTSTKEPHKINNLVEGEKYTLHEDYAPDGFVVATDVEFEVSYDKETQKVDMVDKIVEMSKVDIAGDEIEGATITVLSTRTKNIVDEWVSGKEPHKINGLIEGQIYILHEEIAADGFVKATDIEFTVTTDKETQHIEMIDKVVEITKTDITNGDEVEGAELQVTDEDGNVVDEWISTKEPHKVNNLDEGKKYTLTEITAPYGYEIAESIEFEVSYDKNTQHIKMEDMPILKNVRVEKIDKDTKEHIKSNKFEFGIYEDPECTKLIKIRGANEDEGTALFVNLRYGVYYIKEVKAPLGYRLSDQAVKIEINDEGVFADGISLEEKDCVYSFEYYNTLLPKIQTGSETNYTLLFAIMGVSLVGIVTGFVLLKKKFRK